MLNQDATANVNPCDDDDIQIESMDVCFSLEVNEQATPNKVSYEDELDHLDHMP